MIFMLLQIVTSVEYLPIYGTTEFPGYYYSKISIGTQKKTKKLMIDLGSDLLAVTCIGCSGCGKDQSNYYNYSESSTSVVLHKSSKSTEILGNFNYSVEYVEGSELEGFYIKDSLGFESLNNKYINFTAALGCNSLETGVFTGSFVDGIMGLPIKKRSSSSIVKYLMKTNIISENIFSVCIGTFDGFLSFGGIDESFNHGEISWFPLTEENYFELESDNLLLGTKNLRKTIMIREKFMIASGSTISYFRDSLYREFLKMFQDFCFVEGNCQAKNLKVAEFDGLCFENHRSGESFDFESFPVIEIVVDNVKLLFQPENYLVRIKYDRPASFCLGVLRNNFGHVNVLGTNFLRTKHFYFDLKEMRAGVADSFCDFRMNNSEIEYFVYKVEEISDLEIMRNSFYVFSLFLFMNFVIFGIFVMVKGIGRKIRQENALKFCRLWQV
jgi:hypothetical protein